MGVVGNQKMRRVAEKLGVVSQARQLRQAFEPWHERRNRFDDEQLRRLILLGLSSADSCVDIGANVGTMLTWIQQAAPRGRHIAFEPVPSLRKRLIEQFPNIPVRGEAVSDQTRRVAFTVVKETPSRSGLSPKGLPRGATTEVIEVDAVRLDDALPHDITPRLIKIDVEGAELQVLRGASEIIKSHDVMLAFEHGHGNQDPDLHHALELYDLIRTDLRLRLFDMLGSEFDERAFRSVYLDGSCWNFLARR